MKRRAFLKHTGHSLAVTGLMSSFGFAAAEQRKLVSLLRQAAESDRVLVLIFLQGGNDGLNTVVPLDQYSTLSRVRPHVILPESKVLKLSGATVGLHPSLDFFKSLYNEGRLEIIQSVGYPDQDYSHFRSTDIWMSASGSSQVINNGWTGRYLFEDHPGYPLNYPNETSTDPLAVELGYGASLLFQGPTASMSTVISDPNSFYELVANVEGDAPNTPAGEKLKFVRLIARQSQQYGEVMKRAAAKVTQQEQFPEGNSLADQLKIVSRLICGGLRTPLYLVRLSGFDTHDAQVEANNHASGEHAVLLKKLNDAVKAFMTDLESHGADHRVVGMTFSEFGRRIVSNASLGTDHGAAAPLFVFGNEVRGGVLGNNPIIPALATSNDNLAMQYDFRQIYTSVLQQWLNASESKTDSVMMKTFDTVPIIGPAIVTGVEEVLQTFTVYPNPVLSVATVQFESTGKRLTVEVVDVWGRKIDSIYEGTMPAGIQRLSWNAQHVSQGQYLIVLTQGEQRVVGHVIKG